MKNIKEKIIKIVNKKYFIPFLAVFLCFIHFALCNILFEIRYETIDDFTIMKIISALDGNYSIYGVYIHPFICSIIMMLFKTGININWYTIFILSIGIFSNSLIGIIFMKKNIKYGLLFYIFLFSIYTEILVDLNYTSIAALALISGTISIIYSERSSKKYFFIGLFLVAIGTMLRFKIVIMILPFYIIHIIYEIYSNKNYKKFKNIIYVLSTIIIIYVSNFIIYNINPIYNNYQKFNKIRTYLFDFNVFSYNGNEEKFKKAGWTLNDRNMLYTGSFADEKFYNNQNLLNLKESLSENNDFFFEKTIHAFMRYNKRIIKDYLYLFAILIILIYIIIISKKIKYINKEKGLLYVFLFILLGLGLCFTKPVFRVIISLYLSIITFIIYIILDSEDFKITNKIFDFILLFILTTICVLYCRKTYQKLIKYRREEFSVIKEIVDYTSNNKNNAYVYPNIFRNISRGYSVYEKIEDNMFLNLRNIGDWDIYDEGYYKFKENYNLDNIIEELYKKNNLYLIDGTVSGADNKEYMDHVNLIIDYIKDHYNVSVKYDVIKEFYPYDVRIYKLHEDTK